MASKELPGAEQKLPGQDKFLSALPRPQAGPSAVEKLLLAKFAKIKSRQGALQTTFSVRVDIFYTANSCCFEENGLFQHPQAITLRTRSMSSIKRDVKKVLPRPEGEKICLEIQPTSLL